MACITVLGGCGVVGTAAVKMLATQMEVFSEVVIADFNIQKAKQIAGELEGHVRAIQFDANDISSINSAIKGSDVVLNTVGPYYQYEKPILSTVIELGINYVDVNDDTGATYEALEMDAAAKKAGITALIGMGSSPGITNLLASFAATELLYECESIDMYHAHGFEPSEGPGVIGHRFYCLSNPIPVFLDGQAQLVAQQESAALEEEVEFINLEGRYRVYPYPHPEPITLPMFLKTRGLKRVTNKGTVIPENYYNLTRSIHALGLDSKDPVNVKGQQVIPYDFAIAYLIKKRDEFINKASNKEPRGCVKIVCKGKTKKGQKQTYVFSLVSEGVGKGQALGEGTGIPAALGAVLIQQGKIKKKGVLPPEGCVNVWSFLQLMKRAMKIDDTVEEKKSPLIIESIDADGIVKRMQL
ncbi:MAG TPA: saccharopine dehydrogenase NADP-binding domain-containing protein [Candidatus Deferrimicrobium sp.]|nr:saccharopine dehydrogenase NADP-binding domain-containing protein [Candidatus Deferrimicrobium sp.]